MTIGIAATAGGATSPMVVVAADRLRTAQRESPIEYEHPGSKIRGLADNVDNISAVALLAGDDSLTTELAKKTDAHIEQARKENPEAYIGIREIANSAAGQYNQLIRDAFQFQVLEPYGFELSDLSKQHQFKDAFFNDLMAELSHVQAEIDRNLSMLIAGVDHYGSHIYLIQRGDVTTRTQVGFAVIGSGSGPAESEFMTVQYEPGVDLDNSLAVVTAAKMRAESAQGVGKEMDIAAISQTSKWVADGEEVSILRQRQADIKDEQEAVRERILDERPLEFLQEEAE